MPGHGISYSFHASMESTSMFFAIAFNNIGVAIATFALGIFLCVGTIVKLFQTGLMLGSFEYYFFSKGLGFKSILVVFLHGTLEIWAIVIAGAAGLILGNSILFPKTFTRSVSLLKGGKDGVKILIGLIPVFIVAAFIEGYITRYANMPIALSSSILISSLLFIVWYFILYPMRLRRRIENSIANEGHAKKIKILTNG
ncbi:stage II sporulation protein M [Nostoc sp. HG1]|nr:stage II sporulation protein M [Nostoc sp. HG1]